MDHAATFTARERIDAPPAAGLVHRPQEACAALLVPGSEVGCVFAVSPGRPGPAGDIQHVSMTHPALGNGHPVVAALADRQGHRPVGSGHHTGIAVYPGDVEQPVVAAVVEVPYVHPGPD